MPEEHKDQIEEIKEEMLRLSGLPRETLGEERIKSLAELVFETRTNPKWFVQYILFNWLGIRRQS